jgi:excisionase family DNA binding protein
MRKIASNDDLMTTREVGEALGVAVRTVQLWVESGVLPAWRTAGGHRRIARAAVDKLMSERAMTTDQVAAVLVPLAANVPRQQSFKLLVVEDDPDLRQLFGLMVEGWSVPVALSTASNGFEGLLRMGEHKPDMVVTDLNMPGMDGFEMLRTLCKPDSGFGALHIVVVSVLSVEEINDRGGLPAGVTFFQKPIPYDTLENMVKNLQASKSLV